MSGKRNHSGHRVGEWHPRARLTDDEVRKMRQDNAAGTGIPALARQYAVPYWTAYDICTYKTRASA